MGILNSVVEFASVANGHDGYLPRLIIDLVTDPPITDANPPHLFFGLLSGIHEAGGCHQERKLP
jgi:hypothetical protein